MQAATINQNDPFSSPFSSPLDERNGLDDAGGLSGGSKKRRRRNRTNHSGKGALIKGMSRRLPAEILENRVFTDRLQEIMRGFAGIYALYRHDELYYVGLTRNLLGRIRWHLRDRHKNKWDHFIIFKIQKVRYLKDVETLIHHLVEARGNRVKGKIPRDGDLNRVLREVLREHERAIRGIKHALR
ncbi:MAG: GIY-YIG nuclease family protein [Planctomycetia bacterium]|nr:GIY-YIG nuclease family protein [Planctomycetia bacterium]